MALWNRTGANLSTEEILFLASEVATASSTAAKVFKIIPLALVMLASIISNTVVVYAVYADVRMHTPTNVLIGSQALADFGTSFLVIPFALISVGADGWIFGDNFCFANAFFNLVFTQTTVLQMAIIAFERYLVIVKPSLQVVSLGDAIRLAVSAWGVSFLGAFPWLALLTNNVKVDYFPGFHVCGRRYLHPLGGLALFTVIVIIFVFAVLPLFVISFCYYQIHRVIRRKNQSVCPMALSNKQKLAINVYASSASMSKIVIGTSLIQVFPACFAMLLDGLQVGYIPHGLETGLKWVMWCHCIVKPVIYASKSHAWAKIIGKYRRKFPLCSAIGIRINVVSVSIFANRFKQYRLSKRKTENTAASRETSTKQSLPTPDKIEKSAWFFAAKQAWQTNAKTDEFCTL